MSDVRLRYEVLRAAGDALADELERPTGTESEVQALVAAYRAARDAAVELRSPADEHRCDPPSKDPEDRTSWSARRWDCPECGARWVYVRRMIGRKVRGEWRQMPSPASTAAPAAVPSDQLPVVLASVDDVETVAEACGLTPQGPAIGYTWSDKTRNVIVAWERHPGCVELYRYDTGQHYATFFPGATGAELVAAIEAARGAQT